MRICLFFLCCLLYQQAAAQPRIAIIIDDIGYQQATSKAAIELDPNITVAVIPQSPYGKQLAEYAHLLQRETLIHLPMAANGTDNLDPGGITPEHSAQQIRATVLDAFKRIPNAVGLNNHMGSRTTEDSHAMTAVMNTLAEQEAFFVDSRTSGASVGETVARETGVPSTRRHVFLDNQQDYRSINHQFNQLLQHARQHGSAVAIGHPYPETIAYLKHVLPLLKETEIEVVPVSRLIAF